MTQLGAVSKACHAFVEQNRHVHAPRLLISSSANRLVVEINPENGKFGLAIFLPARPQVALLLKGMV